MLATEAKQLNDTTNISRLIILLALAIGIILVCTLFQHRCSRWKQSPCLLTAKMPVKEDDKNTSSPVPEKKTDKPES